MAAPVRVRFAPSPTGYLHLGSVRVALFNYLFARQKEGSFILRIEDTDQARNRDELVYLIMSDLHWLGLTYNEGPDIGGPFAPYLQSQRTELYQKHALELMALGKVYRCFCTEDELEKKRQRQLATGRPPRYDRQCFNLSHDAVEQKTAQGIPFIWRLKLNDDQVVEINDMARGKVSFELKHFSDPVIARADGSFTFMFANFIDDWLMKVTHVIRGDDHLANTAIQAAFYSELAVPLPTFWHLQMICNAEGKRFSKRDFGFSLHDLRMAGYLPEAICNYGAAMGGSLENEIQSLEELAKSINFEGLHSTSPVRYDTEKLNWINHKWMQRLAPEELLRRVKPFLHQDIPESASVSDHDLARYLKPVISELKTLKDISSLLKFCFVTPETTKDALVERLGAEKVEIILHLLAGVKGHLGEPGLFLEMVKRNMKEKGLGAKEVFGTIRYLLTGSFEGIGMHDLLDLLAPEEMTKRLERI